MSVSMRVVHVVLWCRTLSCRALMSQLDSWTSVAMLVFGSAVDVSCVTLMMCACVVPSWCALINRLLPRLPQVNEVNQRRSVPWGVHMGARHNFPGGTSQNDTTVREDTRSATVYEGEAQEMAVESKRTLDIDATRIARCDPAQHPDYPATTRTRSRGLKAGTWLGRYQLGVLRTRQQPESRVNPWIQGGSCAKRLGQGSG